MPTTSVWDGCGSPPSEGCPEGWTASSRSVRVLYLVCDKRVGRAIERSAAAVGISQMVIVHRVSFNEASGTGRPSDLERTARRAGTERTRSTPLQGRAARTGDVGQPAVP